MEPLKLLPIEAFVLEGIKAGKSQAEITKELNEKQANIYNRIKRLVKLGALNKTGKRKSYVYTPTKHRSKTGCLVTCRCLN